MHAFKIGNWGSDKINLYLPYLNLDKAQILEDAKISIDKLKLDFNTIFKNTLTSYEPDKKGRSNGKTGSDIERIIAFNKNGLEDPLDYIEPWEKVLEYALRSTVLLLFNHWALGQYV